MKMAVPMAVASIFDMLSCIFPVSSLLSDLERDYDTIRIVFLCSCLTTLLSLHLQWIQS